VEVDGHPRIIGWLVAWKLPDGVLTDLFTSQESVVATAARVRGVERVKLCPNPGPRSDWRFGAARLLGCYLCHVAASGFLDLP
jgi:hypothetical protein